MGTIHVTATGKVAASAAVVYGCLANMRDHHPHFLPDAFSDFTVESGGIGAGTIARFKVTAGGKAREYRMTLDETEPGHLLTETDSNSSMVTTFTVTPQGVSSLVEIATTWEGAKGIGGFFERRFAPPVMRKIYLEELGLLDNYVRQLQTGGDSN